MELTIGKYRVTIKDKLTWGDMQVVQASMAAGTKVTVGTFQGFDATALIEAKYKLLEVAVLGIVDTTLDPAIGQFPFTRDWMNALDVEEGNTLFEAIDALDKKK